MPKDVYYMPHHEIEAERLNRQGLTYESAFGYQVHPDITRTLPTSPLIADIGTGTGDYLVRLSRKFPKDSRFDGFDISSGCFCAEDKRPENVMLHIHDVRLPFPTEYHGKFDVVHLRLIVLGLEHDDWAIATRHVVQLLKPGGAIQWEETGFLGMRCVRGNPGTKCTNLEFLLRLSSSEAKARLEADATSRLPGLFKEAGLETVFQDVVACDRVLEDRRNYGAVLTDGAKSLLLATGKYGSLESRKSLEGMVRGAYQDLENGAYWQIDHFATIGFKPV